MNNNDSNNLLFNDNYKQQIDIWYKAYNINNEKLNLFHDFIITLYQIINETYLGADVLTKDEDQKNHFIWCWKKLLNSFEKENIHFKDNGIHFEYFWNFFRESYYYRQIENELLNIPNYFNILFDFNHVKTSSELDVIVELYKLLNENLKK